jgi:hypothetical protein
MIKVNQEEMMHMRERVVEENSSPPSRQASVSTGYRTGVLHKEEYETALMEKYTEP